jgi:transcriptional regulator GlxA family with amidase domain
VDKRHTPRRIAVVVYDGFDELDAIGPFEVFSNARRLGVSWEVSLVTREEQDVVTGTHGLQLVPSGRLRHDHDLIVVPGGAWDGREAVGAWGEAERGHLPRAIAEAHGRGSLVASVCSGAMLLAAVGLTAGRPAVTHDGAMDDLARSGAIIVQARVVDDGDIVTSGGVTAGIDMALWLVERCVNGELADRIARVMEHRRDAEIVHP